MRTNLGVTETYIKSSDKEQRRKIPTENISVSRRNWLKYTVAGLTTATVSQSLYALTEIVRFENEPVVVQFGKVGQGVGQLFILNGTLGIFDDELIGSVTVTFPDSTRGTIVFSRERTFVSYRSVQVGLQPESLDTIIMNGLVVGLNAVVAELQQENNFTGIGPLSDLSQALLVPVALGSAPAWLRIVTELRSAPTPEVTIQLFGRRLFRLIAKVVAMAVAVVTCGTFIACVAGATITLPLIGVVTCPTIGQICAATTAVAVASIIERDLPTIPIVRGTFPLVQDYMTAGFYNAALGTILDGTSPLFPIPLSRDEIDIIRIVPAPEPNLSPAAAILGNWLSRNPLPLNNNWSDLQPIPASWESTTETAIIYRIDAGPSPVRLTGDFAVDNGIFVWVNGQFRFGAIEPGPVVGFEYVNVDLGTVSPGINFIQILREDHGDQTNYSHRLRHDRPLANLGYPLVGFPFRLLTGGKSIMRLKQFAPWIVASLMAVLSPSVSHATLILQAPIVSTPLTFAASFEWSAGGNIGFEPADNLGGPNWDVDLATSQAGEFVLVTAQHLVAPHASDVAPNPFILFAFAASVAPGQSGGPIVSVVPHPRIDFDSLVVTIGATDADTSLITINAAHVPEPSTAILAGVGGLALLAGCWRRRRAQ